jgi:hypothetical protein
MFEWPALALIIYVGIAALLLLRIVSALWRAKKAASAATRVSVGLVNELGYPWPEVRELTGLDVPFTLGRRNPIIVLPDTWRRWDDFKLRSVLAHELAHIHRGDWITAFVAGVNAALFWFHPVAWWLESRLTSLAEEACDARAVRLAGDPAKYASVVLEFAQAAALRRLPLATSMARTSKVARRINRILEGGGRLNRAVSGLSWAVMLAVATPAAYAVSAVQLSPALNTPPSTYGLMPHREGYQAIMSDGWTLTADEAVKLESEIERDPENLAARVRLLSYYTQYIVELELRSKHLLWLIEHHPDSDVFQLNTKATAITPDYSGIHSPSIERARVLWLQQVERYATNTRVLSNAATVLAVLDGKVAFELLRRLRALEPQNTEWLEWQADVYATAVRSSFADGTPQSRMWPRAGKSFHSGFFRLPAIDNQLLKNELESSSDVALVESTADVLLDEIALLKKNALNPETFGADPEIQATETLARQLKVRAQQLKSQ